MSEKKIKSMNVLLSDKGSWAYLRLLQSADKQHSCNSSDSVKISSKSTMSSNTILVIASLIAIVVPDQIYNPELKELKNGVPVSTTLIIDILIQYTFSFI